MDGHDTRQVCGPVLGDGASTKAPLKDTGWTPEEECTSRPARMTAFGTPTHIGRYRIVRLLGEGGMGAVYEAEQEHPRRVVALKVIKPGLTNPELLRRFEQESRSLGRLQHPGIAQIYEAGSDDQGFGPQPYIAMEFIRGRGLREYTEAAGLTPRQRLEMLAKICDAVQHAQQRGLIHRDLKPGNILVDEHGQPKILDFGLSRATDRDGEATRETELGQVIGTLAYMSPEQVLGDPLEVDTRTDVYALGVILYELLAGRLPYRVGSKLHEAVQTIREEDATLLGAIRRVYRGDVETIVAKALEKDKVRRYLSPAEFAADIRRYLRDEAVLARPPGVMYQLHKFVRRHKALVAGALAVFVALSGGIVASTREAARATQARNQALAEKQRADTEAATARTVNDFLQNDLLAQASEVGSMRQRGAKPDPDLKVRAVLDRAAAGVGARFQSQPIVEAALRRTIGLAYYGLGLYLEAERQMERSADLRSRALGPNHKDTLDSMSYLADTYREQGKLIEAEALFTRVLEAQRRVIGNEHPDTLRTANNLALVYIGQGKYAQTEPLLVDVVKANRRVRGEEDPETLSDMNNLASTYGYLGRFKQAEELDVDLLSILRRVLGDEQPQTLNTISNLADIYRAEGKFHQAEPLVTRALEVRRRLLGEEHPETLISMSVLALVYRGEGRYTEAEPLFTKVLDGRRRLLGEHNIDTLKSATYLADLYRNQGKEIQAKALYTQVLKTLSDLPGGRDHPQTLNTMNSLALLYLGQREYAKAEELFSSVLEGRRRKLGGEHPATISALVLLGRTRLQQGKYTAAESMIREALQLQEKANSESWERYNTQSMLGACLLRQARYGEAEPLLQSGLRGLVEREATMPRENSPVLKEAGRRIVQLYEDWGKPEQAARWREKLRLVMMAGHTTP